MTTNPKTNPTLTLTLNSNLHPSWTEYLQVCINLAMIEDQSDRHQHLRISRCHLHIIKAIIRWVNTKLVCDAGDRQSFVNMTVHFYLGVQAQPTVFRALGIMNAILVMLKTKQFLAFVIYLELMFTDFILLVESFESLNCLILGLWGLLTVKNGQSRIEIAFFFPSIFSLS